MKVARMHAQLRGAAFLAFGDDGADADEQHATAANRFCVEASMKWQYWTSEVERCRAWVSDRDPLVALEPGLAPTLLGPGMLVSQPAFVDRQNEVLSNL